MNVQIFLAFNKRVEDIWALAPAESAAKLDTDYRQLNPASVAMTRVWIKKYLNLCSEEHLLWEQNFIAGWVWMIWEMEIKQTVRSTLFRSAWSELQGEYRSHESFHKFIQDVLKVEQ